MNEERPQTEQLIFAHRPSGQVFMRCVRMTDVEPETVRALQAELEGFIDKCHADFICFVAAMAGAQTGRPAWNAENQEPVQIMAVASDGTKRAIQTSVLPKEAADLFSTEGQLHGPGLSHALRMKSTSLGGAPSSASRPPRRRVRLRPQRHSARQTARSDASPSDLLHGPAQLRGDRTSGD